MVSVGPEKSWQAVPPQPGTPRNDRAASNAQQPGTDSPEAQSAAREFEARVSALIQQHASVLLDEPLLPLAVVTPSGGDESARSVLVALDGRGRQAVVTVVHHLDLPALMSAIQVAGRLGFRSRSAMAKSYPGGGAAFDDALARFYATRPDLQATVGQLSTQPRLIVVCGAATPDANEALRFLGTGGGGIEIFPLTAQVVNRVIAKVRGTAEPAAAAQPAQPQPEPDQDVAIPIPTASTTPQVRPAAPAPPADVPAAPPAPAETAAKTKPAPPASAASVAEPASPTSAAPAANAKPAPPAQTQQSHAAPRKSEPAADTGAVPIPDDTDFVEPPAQPAVVGDQPIADQVEHDHAAANHAAAHPAATHQVAPSTPRRGQPFARTEPLAITTEIPIIDAKRRLPRTVLPKPIDGVARPPARSLAVRTVALEAAVTGKTAEELTPTAGHRDTERDIQVLCDELESAVPIVWVRQGSGERYEAVLHPEGMITLPTGIEYADPTRAARAISGSLSVADGWNLWRIGEYGPTLAEAWQEVFGR